MFIIDLAYIAPIEAIDRHLDAHVDYLKEQYRAGVFLASGRKTPRTGGVILAKCPNREALDAIIALDPFHAENLAEYTITEFTPGMTAPGLESLKE